MKNNSLMISVTYDSNSKTPNTDRRPPDYLVSARKPRVFPGIGPNPADSGFTGPWPGPSERRPGLRRDGRWREHMVNIRASAGPRARRCGPRSGGAFHGPVHRWTPRSGGGGEHGALPLPEHQAGAVDVRAGTASATAPAKPSFPWLRTRSRPRCSRLLMADPPAAWARRAPRNASPLSRTRSAFDSLPLRGIAAAPASRQAPAGPGGCADRGRSSPPTGRGTGPAPPRPWGPPRPRRSPPTSPNGAGGIRDGPQGRGPERRAPPGPRPFPSISSGCAALISGAPSRGAGPSLPSGSAVRSGPPGA